MNALSERQTAKVGMRLGKRVKFVARADLTPAGLLAISALVCGILLSTSVIVKTALDGNGR
ncbi:hypothetical protein GRI97_10940 [Altererythrobacter xixiisoli]|uniref:Uncharacterized protein n=1 Tax=Croceibacterium xixiisoli TaxID=1476466 RepID=A0A6I4TUA9_9SPHN|nr:hypothetical protein [Croceibacterium xixiisoli]MXO99504.1 hypothetical protein [Croceibacterium xixiisoli]